MDTCITCMCILHTYVHMSFDKRLMSGRTACCDWIPLKSVHWGRAFQSNSDTIRLALSPIPQLLDLRMENGRSGLRQQDPNINMVLPTFLTRSEPAENRDFSKVDIQVESDKSGCTNNDNNNNNDNDNNNDNTLPRRV